MDKTTFNEELREYMSRGGDFAFVFGEQHLPVKYNALMGTLGVSMNEERVMTVVAYDRDLGDNLDRLMDKLLVRYPELTA